jgi:hypothetical protein
MSHYQKLAVIIIRMIAVGVTLSALVGMAFGVLAVVLLHGFFATEGLIVLVIGAILGIVLFALSKPLAALIARGL